MPSQSVIRLQGRNRQLWALEISLSNGLNVEVTTHLSKTLKEDTQKNVAVKDVAVKDRAADGAEDK